MRERVVPLRTEEELSWSLGCFAGGKMRVSTTGGMLGVLVEAGTPCPGIETGARGEKGNGS